MLQWVAAFAAVLAMLLAAALDGAGIFRATAHAADLEAVATAIANSEGQYGCFTDMLNASLPPYLNANDLSIAQTQVLVSNPTAPAANGQLVYAQVNYTSFVRIYLPFGLAATLPETFSRSAAAVSEYAPGGPTPPCTPPAGFGGG